MTDDGAASPASGRPLCPCHGQPMDRPGVSSEGGPTCAVGRRERQTARYHVAADAENYARTRRALRARIALKRAQIKKLEAALETQDTRRAGAVQDR